jgi:hypothetical protein
MAGGSMSRQKNPLQFHVLDLDLLLTDPAGVSTSVRPGRGRNRTKTEQEEKIRKPVDNVPRKSPPARKAPSRGRYVDEYAYPTP